MASNMKQQYFALVSLFIAINLFVCIAGEEVAAEGAKKEAAQGGPQFLKLPTLVLRQNGGETEFIWAWTKWPAVQNTPWSGQLDQFVNTAKPYTSQANQWIGRVPGLSDAWSNYNEMASQMTSNMDMSQIFSQFQNLGR